jgi:hypothetical protein
LREIRREELLSKEKQRKRINLEHIRYFALAKVSYIGKTQRMADRRI